ncbi:SDR family NAD(P)-dependent oxidoreductase [Microbacterium sp. 18062]|uniref:SDR family NAD(P)-dependent oxidoreductase n=1 Tax=Microbacterium sp. 18062 TaxID=2681410 RepID=UPI0013598CBB|nr:SDR family oxidoreductase [Microbacterium sp. 18062]
MSLEGKVAVVTGGARGIGRALAEGLAAAGADIASLDLTDSAELVASVTAMGRRAVGVPTDVSSPESVAAAAVAVEAELGPAHILVNNAGLHPHQTSFADTSWELWSKTMRVNLDAMFLTSKAFYTQMNANGWGRIINMSSSVVNVAPLGGVHYIASKAGVLGLTRALARELGPHITANALAPSLVDTPGLSETGISQEVYDAVVGAQVLQELTTAKDLAGLVVFLCSHEARFFTGQHLHIDGGMVFGD